MKCEKMLTFTTKYNHRNVRYMGHLILKENDDPQAVMAKHRLAKQIESYEVSPLLPHAAIVVRMYQAYHGYYGSTMRRLDKDNRKGYFPKKRNRVERKMHQRKRETATEAFRPVYVDFHTQTVVPKGCPKPQDPNKGRTVLI